MVVMLGATGHTGSAVASLDDAAALTKVFQGASAVYLFVPPNYGASS